MSRLARLAALTACAALAWAAPASADSLVSAGSPPAPFPQSKQNEPTVAIDPLHPQVVVAGANDEIDEPPCAAADCPFAPGIGVSGFYVSTDGGTTWTQPTYTGYSGRTGAPGAGPIGTLPNYAAAGLASDGDPALAFGPRPGADGRFSWANGERLYYANLAANLSSVRGDASFRGFEAIAVSHTDDLAGAAAGVDAAWSGPAVVSSARQSATTFSDKEAVWADDAATSPYFGTVYVCWTDFRGNGSTSPEPIVISRSSDGGASWSRPRALSSSFDNTRLGGRQGCDVKTDSRGGVYAFFEGVAGGLPAQMLTRSTDGGRTFSRPRAVARVVDVGGPDVVAPESDAFDGVAGARADSFPHASIANGAPSGAHAPDTIALMWTDGARGLGSETAQLILSDRGGAHWTAPVDAAQAGDRPLMPAIALSPDGRTAYVVYDGVTDPFRFDLAGSRTVGGVLRSAPVGGTAVGPFGTLWRGATGDGRATSANALTDEFLGDYNGVAATDAGAVAVYDDASAASLCPAIDAFRQALVSGGSPPAPAPGTDCPPAFGNTDIRAARAP